MAETVVSEPTYAEFFDELLGCEVRSQFRNDGLDMQNADPWNGSEVHAQEAVTTPLANQRRSRSIQQVQLVEPQIHVP